jgi:deoxyribodipyrimidine photo-lyase
MTPTLLWFRQDLRLQDNPALDAALARRAPIVPIFILDDAGEGRWAPGGASRWWLHHALAGLAESLAARGSRLILARGDSGEVLRRLARETGAGALYWNRRYEPAVIARDRGLKAEFTAAGCDGRVSTGPCCTSRTPSPTGRAGRSRCSRPSGGTVSRCRWRRRGGSPRRCGCRHRRAGRSRSRCRNSALQPEIAWDAGLRATWTPGEAGAAQRLRQFVAEAMEAYADRRNVPGVDGTSMLSPWLHWGELSPRQVWAAVAEVARDSGVFPPSNGARVFLSEVGWREFAYHLLYHFPHTPERPLREEFAAFPWAEDPGGVKLRAWQRGRTGYPIVDAGMRQLWHTGWMHNRVRMIVASFLVKHLRLPWSHGAAWFWDTLVDADLASNTLGWQWTAGCGADAAPYFRMFRAGAAGPEVRSDGRLRAAVGAGACAPAGGAPARALGGAGAGAGRGRRAAGTGGKLPGAHCRPRHGAGGGAGGVAGFARWRRGWRRVKRARMRPRRCSLIA